jgi:hypothetical protein
LGTVVVCVVVEVVDALPMVVEEEIDVVIVF